MDNENSEQDESLKRGAPKGNANARKHGLGSLKKAWSEEAVSTQQLAIVDLCGKQKILLDSIDTWLLSQPSLINHRKRSLLPVVIQRQALADGLSRYLAQLGLERRHKVKSLHDILAANDHNDTPVTTNGTADGEP